MQFILCLIVENVFSAPVTVAEMPHHIPQSCVDPSTQMAWGHHGEEPAPVVITNPTDTYNSQKSS
jgi:hypothetical protein